MARIGHWVRSSMAEPGAEGAAAEGYQGPSAAMRRLLRAPRYFDVLAENGSGANMADVATLADSHRRCYNCGLSGHRARDCPNERKLKPCYVCGEYGHESRACPARIVSDGRRAAARVAASVSQRQLDRRGASAGTAPAGAFGADISTPFLRHATYPDGRERYAAGDLAGLTCYVCGKSLTATGAAAEGRLCCKEHFPEDDAADTSVRTCYNCGASGHDGPHCPNPARGYPAGGGGGVGGGAQRFGGGPAAAPMTCFACGQEGHIRRDCPNAPSYGGRGGGRGGGYPFRGGPARPPHQNGTGYFSQGGRHVFFE